VFYRAFLNISTTSLAKEKLKEMLKGENAIVKERGSPQMKNTLINNRASALSLKTKDKFDIVTKLLILNDADAPQLLTELEKTETSDEAKRYLYAARAGVATGENKKKYFEDFLNNKEISESYIETAVISFNPVKHSELTLSFLEKALFELPNLKRNRKIFFINNWLGAFIGGQKDQRALQIVKKFLSDNPNLDRDLRLKILENVDILERAVKIKTKFGN
jgi:aminopeptidase N